MAWVPQEILSPAKYINGQYTVNFNADFLAPPDYKETFTSALLQLTEIYQSEPHELDYMHFSNMHSARRMNTCYANSLWRDGAIWRSTPYINSLLGRIHVSPTQGT